MKPQNILLLLTILAILAKDVTCAKNENEPDENEPDENEPDENEPDENEGGHKHQKSKALSSDSVQSSASVWASVTPKSVSSSWSATSASIPTGAADSAWTSVASHASAIQTSVISAASDISAVQSSVASTASSWVASGYAPSAIGSSSKAPLPSVSAARPYAGPSVISESNHVGISFGIATVGILAFLLTLA